MDNSLTVDQATDLAKYLLGPKWYALVVPADVSTWGVDIYILTNGYSDTPTYRSVSWRRVFRDAGIKLTSRPKFVQLDARVMKGDQLIATACSHNYAARIVDALNRAGV